MTKTCKDCRVVINKSRTYCTECRIEHRRLSDRQNKLSKRKRIKDNLLLDFIRIEYRDLKIRDTKMVIDIKKIDLIAFKHIVKEYPFMLTNYGNAFDYIKNNNENGK